MKAPPPTPELCGSTRHSMAWTAIAASTALPPRFRTLSPACAASGLAAMTNGAVGRSCAGATARAVGAQRARGQRARGRKRACGARAWPRRLAEDEWRSQSIPLRSRAGEWNRHGASARTFRQSRRACSLRAPRRRATQPFLWAKRDGEWRSISWAEAARQVAALAASAEAHRARARRPRVRWSARTGPNG